MPASFIACYSIRVRERQSRTDLPLGGFLPGISLESVIADVIDDLTREAHVDDESQHFVQVTRVLKTQGEIRGQLSAGEYGRTAQGFNVRTNSRTYERRPPDAELVPLYFRFYLPDNQAVGVLLLQRYGHTGVFSQLKGLIAEAFRQRCPDHVLEIRQFAPAQLLQDMLAGGVKEVSLVTHRLPEDIADRLRLGGAEADVGTVEITVRAKRKGALRPDSALWRQALAGENSRLAELALRQDRGRLRVKVQYRGRERQYDFSRPDIATAYLDLTDQVTAGADGHPEFASLDAFCEGLRDEILHDLGRELRR